MKVKLVLVTLIMALTTIGVGPGAAKDVEKSYTTAEALQAAYTQEMDSQSKYGDFARKADAEGYGKIASLFRAAEISSKFNALKIASVMKEMSAEPKYVHYLPDVKSTAENLESALNMCSFRRDHLFPDFINVAKRVINSDAGAAFSRLLNCESELCATFKEMRDNLESLKGSENQYFYICRSCGHIHDSFEFNECPNCHDRAEMFFRTK